jgi:hypothetical protein
MERIFEVIVNPAEPKNKYKVIVAGLAGQVVAVVASSEHEVLAEMVAARLNEALENSIEEAKAEWLVTHQAE